MKSLSGFSWSLSNESAGVADKAAVFERTRMSHG